MENMMTPADVAAVTRNNYGNDGFGFGGGGFFWIFALLLLPMLSGGGMWGNRGNAVTEADLCNANSFSELKGSVGRLSDQATNMYMGLTNGISNLGYELQGLLNSLAAQIAQCCCELKGEISNLRFDMANYFAQSNANTTAGIQKILDKMCEGEKAQMAARIQQLELREAMQGVVRYPTGYTYNAGRNPFCAVQTSCGNYQDF